MDKSFRMLTLCTCLNCVSFKCKCNIHLIYVSVIQTHPSALVSACFILDLQESNLFLGFLQTHVCADSILKSHMFNLTSNFT